MLVNVRYRLQTINSLVRPENIPAIIKKYNLLIIFIINRTLHQKIMKIFRYLENMCKRIQFSTQFIGMLLSLNLWHTLTVIIDIY